MFALVINGPIQIFIALGLMALILYFIYNKKSWQIPYMPAWVSCAVFSIKIIALFAYFFVYSFIYTNPLEADIYKYYLDGKAITQYFQIDPSGYFRILFGFENQADALYLNQNTQHWYKSFEEFTFNENRFIIRFHALLNPITQYSYFAHGIITSLFSYWGTLLLFKSIIPSIQNYKRLVALSIFLLPSLLFWNAGVLKEPFITLGIGMLSYSLFKNKYSLILPSLILIIAAKEYIFFALIPGTIAAIISRYYNSKIYLNYIFSFILCGILIVAFSEFTSLNFWNIIQKKQLAFINVSTLNNAKSQFNMTELEPHFSSILKSIPTAIFNSLFRPLPHEWKSPLYLLSSLEIILIWCLGIYCVIKGRFKNIINNSFVLFGISFIITLSIIIGLTVDNSGSIVRYRMPLLPFLFIIFIVLLPKNKPYDLDKSI